MAVFALIAIGHGLFLRRDDDAHKSSVPTSEWQWLGRFVQTREADADASRDLELLLGLTAREMFERSYELGAAIRRASAYPALQECIRVLDQARGATSWIAEVGLCHGLMAEETAGGLLSGDWQIVEQLSQHGSVPRY
jgi:hypothetical protein